MEDEDNGLEGQEAKRTVNIFSVLDDASAKKQKGKKKFDEDEAIPLKSNTTNIEPEKGSLKLEKKERKAVNTDVFSLEDEPEEDKRE